MPIEIPGPLTESTQDEATIIADEYYGNKFYYNNEDGPLFLGHLQATGTILLGVGSLTTGTSVNVTQTVNGNSKLSATDAAIGTLLVPGVASIANSQMGTFIGASGSLQSLTVSTFTNALGSIASLSNVILSSGTVNAGSINATLANFNNVAIATLTNVITSSGTVNAGSIAATLANFNTAGIATLTNVITSSGTLTVGSVTGTLANFNNAGISSLTNLITSSGIINAGSIAATLANINNATISTLTNVITSSATISTGSISGGLANFSNAAIATLTNVITSSGTITAGSTSSTFANFNNVGISSLTALSLTGNSLTYSYGSISTVTANIAVISTLSGSSLSYSSGSLLILSSATITSGSINSSLINVSQLTTSTLVVNATTAPSGSGSAPTFFVDTADNKLRSVSSSAGTSTYAPGKLKGDMAIHSGITETRLPVGSDNQLLVADPSQTLGVRWGPINSVVGAFGSEYFSVDNVLTNGQTTATTFQSFLSLSPILLGGTYLVSSSCVLSSNGNQARSAQVITLIDTSTVSNQTLLLSTTIGTVSIADFRSMSVPAGTHTVSLQYRNQTAGSTLTISAAKLLVYRAN